MFDISFDPVNDTASLADRWCALEGVCSGGFFRSWSYLRTLLPHCLAPRLLAVRQDGRDLALGLFNATRSWAGTRLCLHEVGSQPLDGLYVEHNGLLLRPGAQGCLPAALEAAARHGTVVLSGIDTLHLHAAHQAGTVALRSTSQAPAIDLAALGATAQPYVETLSANTRAQIRRALRLQGPGLTLTPARDVAEALRFLDRLMALHQASWTARGKPGAFAMPAVSTFHSRLVQAALPRGQVALLRVSAGTREVGYLYQFQHGGAVLNYQSGLASSSDGRCKPGLVCHTLAIAHALAEGAVTYDFLAGAARYKTSLLPGVAHIREDLHWIDLHARGSAGGRWAALKSRARAWEMFTPMGKIGGAVPAPPDPPSSVLASLP